MGIYFNNYILLPYCMVLMALVAVIDLLGPGRYIRLGQVGMGNLHQIA